MAEFDGCFDLTRMAVLETTVSMAFNPAAFIVSPDSGDCQRLCFPKAQDTNRQDPQCHQQRPVHKLPPHSHLIR